MKLHGSYTSPYVRHCRIVLARTGLDCEFVETDHSQSAKQSPTARVPFLEDGDLMLTDSASILKYLRERAGEKFFADVREYDQFLLVNTALDSTVNVFLLGMDGVTPDASQYFGRQQFRIEQTLGWLDDLVAGDRLARGGDAELRLGCYLSWALFRERFTLADWPALARFQKQFEEDPVVAATHPAKNQKR